MKLGILICDQVQPQLQAEFGDYPDMFGDILHKVDSTLEVVYFSAINQQLPEDIQACDAYMTSGSRFGVNDEQPWIRELEAFIRQLYKAGIGFAGICFGHQLIATSLGGRVEKSPKGWGIGIAFSDVAAPQSWMSPMKNNINIVVSHQDQITELPPESQVLMGNDFCPYSMIKVSDNFVGIQGHPEFSREYSYALMDSRRDRISAARIEQGSASLVHQADDLLAMQWLVNFLKQVK